VVDNFDMAKTELKKYSIEARENVRFLSTLERHFKERGNRKFDFGWIYQFFIRFGLFGIRFTPDKRIFNIQMILELYSTQFLP